MDRVIQPERLTLKLINDSTIQVRSLTLSERQKCLNFLPAILDEEAALKDNSIAEKYMKAQGDIIHFAITRLNPDFKRDEVDDLVTGDQVKKIFSYIFVDPFESSE